MVTLALAARVYISWEKSNLTAGLPALAGLACSEMSLAERARQGHQRGPVDASLLYLSTWTEHRWAGFRVPLQKPQRAPHLSQRFRGLKLPGWTSTEPPQRRRTRITTTRQGPITSLTTQISRPMSGIVTPLHGFQKNASLSLVHRISRYP